VEADYFATIEGIPFMNHLVFLDANAGELEKILSGVKTMILKEFDPAQPPAPPVSPSDNLYFLRNEADCALRVKATVVRVLFLNKQPEEDLSHILKEMQPKLQFSESQYNYWSVNPHIVLVEFDSAHKIDVIQVASNKITDRSHWIPFEAFSLIKD
jgi:hypothetical protein